VPFSIPVLRQNTKVHLIVARPTFLSALDQQLKAMEDDNPGSLPEKIWYARIRAAPASSIKSVGVVFFQSADFVRVGITICGATGTTQLSSVPNGLREVIQDRKR
jgi:hypothetical protein